MRYAIVYSSRTGNTARLAETIRETLGQETCLYFGPQTPGPWRRRPCTWDFGRTRGPATRPSPSF